MKILFFSPHAYWEVHAQPEALVAETLKLLGHEVVLVNCDGLYKNNCICMPLVDLTDFEKKNAICNICKRSRNSIAKEFSIRSINIDGYVDDKMISDVNNMVELATLENYLDINLNGIPIAKYALYEFILNHKLSSTVIPTELWSEYRENLRNALITHYAIHKIITYEQPDRITTYNSLYGVNRIVCAVAEQFRIPHFTLHAGSHHKKRLQQMTIFRGIEASVLTNQHPALERFRELPLTVSQIKLVNEHVSQLFDASSLWVYTTKSKKLSSTQLRSRLGIQEGQKILLAVMRSNDERLGLKLAGMDIFEAAPVFKSQYDWLDWLVKYAVKNPEQSVIFRVHPREYPNKREKKLSQNAIKFEEYTRNANFPKNLIINTPADDLSLHDLLKITDVVLNSTSTVGLEACLFGIPVIGMSERTYAFDPILQREAVDVADYELKINEALQSGLSFGRVISAYRWLNYVFCEVCIDISDGYAVRLSPFRWIFSTFVKVLRKLRLYSATTLPLGHVADRKRPLTHSERLSYAIVNNLESHIGFLPLSTVVGNVQTELAFIREHYLKTMRKISNRDDAEFQSRVEKCLDSITSV